MEEDVGQRVLFAIREVNTGSNVIEKRGFTSQRRTSEVPGMPYYIEVRGWTSKMDPGTHIVRMKRRNLSYRCHDGYPAFVLVTESFSER